MNDAVLTPFKSTYLQMLSLKMKLTHSTLKTKHLAWSISTSLALSLFATSAFAQPTQSARPAQPASTVLASEKASVSDLAAKLTNPVADLISVPFQYNYDANIGLDKKGTINSLVVQPVIPIKLNSNWNYIVRPVVTFEQANSVNGFSGTGTGPVLLETFFSPSNASDFIWGVGPIVSTPSLSGNNFGTAQTGVGVSAVALVMKKPWTAGLLAYNTWDAGGNSAYGTANNLFYQPFVSYVTPTAWTFTVNTQSTFNWDARRAENPINATVSKIVKFGELPVSLSVGARYYASAVPGGPSGWGGRASMTFLFPR
jgi:hypothetical protein